MLDLSKVTIRVQLPERYVIWVSAGSPAEVTISALTDQAFEGRVTSVVPQADEAARNLPVEITLDNPDGLIKAGLSARVSIRGPERKALTVPKDALVLSERGVTVYVVKGGEAFPVEVTVGPSHEQDVEVTGDIAPGQIVVTEGNERLRPGQKVQIAKPDDGGKEPEKGQGPPPEKK
jgi:membrane fusion protein (multidrug efflux system)